MSNAPIDAAAARRQLLLSLRHGSRDPSLPDAVRRQLRAAARQLRRERLAVRDERRRYAALFHAVPDPISIIAADGTLLDVNAATMQAYQRPRSELVGQHLHVLNPDLPHDHMRPVLDRLRQGGSHVVETTNLRADGNRFPVEVHSAWLDWHGQRAVIAVARDLSMRQQADLRFRQAFEAIDKGMVAQGIDGSASYANAAALRILGAPADQDLTAYLSPSDWSFLDERGRPIAAENSPPVRALRTGQIIPSTVYGLVHRPSKRLRWLSATTVPVFTPGSHKPHQVIWMFSDVTALKRDSALFDRAQALAHIGGWEWEPGSDALYLTEESGRILGQPQRPASMQAFLACLRRPDAERLREALQVAASHGVGIDLELQGLRGDGRSFWIRMLGQPDATDAGMHRIAGTLQDILEGKQAEQTLRIQARTDPLTGLLNRDAILRELHVRLQDSASCRLAVLYIDLDRFKTVNDVLGHGAGDTLLYSAAQRIVDAVGNEGLVARLGGDEFVVVCNHGDDAARPERLADAVLNGFRDSFRFGKEEFPVTASIGIARAPEHGMQAQTLIQNADAAMYASKRRMRNGWMAYHADMAHDQHRSLQVETHLRHALENDEFHLVYQPQVDLRSGRTIGAEALIRWRHRQLGEMRPDHFIALAESNGDIVHIGNWVLRAACRQIAAWRAAGLGQVRIAVNVSYRQFLAADLPAIVQELLHQFDLPGEALELEFTERTLIEDAPETLQAFTRLRAMGIALAIDDFGEGYSALNYLRRLPIQGLKLSGLFVQGIPANRSDMAVCKAVASIADSLELDLVAEGIETGEQRQHLLDLGVRKGQGFLFSPGLLADDFAQRLLDEAVAVAAQEQVG